MTLIAGLEDHVAELQTPLPAIHQISTRCAFINFELTIRVIISNILFILLMQIIQTIIT